MHFVNLGGLGVTIEQVDAAVQSRFPDYRYSYSFNEHYTLDRASGRLVKVRPKRVHVAFDADLGALLLMDGSALRCKPWLPRFSLRVVLSVFGLGWSRRRALCRELLDFVAEHFGGEVQHPHDGLRELFGGRR